MPTYLHPGVYIEEIPSGLKPIGGVATSVAAFIGFTTKGTLNIPTRIGKWDDYTNDFGGIRDTGKEPKGDPMGHAVVAFFQNGGANAYIVRIAQGAVKAQGFMDHPAPDNTTDALQFSAVNEGAWANGMVVQLNPMDVNTSLYDLEIGWRNDKGEFIARESFSNLSIDDNDPLYIENVVNGVSELLAIDLVPLSDIPTGELLEHYLGTSTSGDLAGVSLDFSETPAYDEPETRQLKISLDGTAEFTITLLQESFDLESLATGIQGLVRTGAQAVRRTNFTCAVSGSNLIFTSGTRTDKSSVVVGDTAISTILLLGGNAGTETTTQQTGTQVTDSWDDINVPIFMEATLSSGSDGSAPNLVDYQSVFATLVKYRDITMLSLPDQAWDDAGKPALSAAIAHAEQIKNRLVFIDPPATTELDSAVAVAALGLPTSTYTVLYYPWVKVANPNFDAERNPGVPRSVLVPPGGFAAGMWSRIDGRRGVWKAPAGVETSLLGLADLEYRITDGDQDQLNPLGINCLRALPNYGAVIWGARTLATNADPEWRYIPVRRTAIMIEQSTYNGLQWAVFESNDHRLWSALRLNIESFMDGLFRAGAFQGEKASDAYFVRCGLGDSMSQGDIDRGQVIVVIGFAPLKPAEFVIIRIQQKLGKQ